MCLPNCTRLAGFRVLLVLAFASYLARILIFLGISGPEYFYCHPLNYCFPSSNSNCLGKFVTQLKLVFRPESLAPGNIFIVTLYIKTTLRADLGLRAGLQGSVLWGFASRWDVGVSEK